MTKKLLLFITILLGCYLFSQPLKITRFSSKIKEAEAILLQEKNFLKDSVSLKKFLAPLLQTKIIEHQILYNGLLANGYSNYYDKYNGKSNALYKKSIALAQKSGSKSYLIWAELNYSSYRYHYNQYSQMLPRFISAVKEIEKLKEDEIIFPVQTYKKIAWVMQTIGANDDAINYFLKIVNKTPYYSSERAAVLDNLGISYCKTGNEDKALQLFHEAKIIAYKIKDSLRIAKIYGNIGSIFLQKKQYDKAIISIKKDILISEKVENPKNNMYAYQLLAKAYIGQKKLTEADLYLDQAEKIALSYDYFRGEELDILKLRLATVGENQQKELSLRKKIAELEEFSKTTDGEEIVNTANLLVQKAKYESQIDQANTDLKESSFQKKAISSVLGLLILISFFLYRSYRSKLKYRKQQIENEKINAEITKKDYQKKLTETEQSITAQIELLKDKNTLIFTLNDEIQALKINGAFNDKEKRDELAKILESHLMTDENWNHFKNAFIQKYPDFYKDLNDQLPNLTISNLRVILLHKLNFNNTEIAGLVGISADAVKKSKQRLRKKFADKNEVLEELITPFSK